MKKEVNEIILKIIAGNVSVSEASDEICKILDEEKKWRYETNWEYAIMPVSFKQDDYNKYVDILNEYTKNGWQPIQLIRDYDNSPVNGYVTHDYLFRRQKRSVVLSCGNNSN